MATAKVDIYNLALGMVGAKRLTTITDAVEEQRIVTNVYALLLDEVLGEHSWSFAQKRHELVDMTEPTDDFDAWVTATDYEAGDGVLNGTTNYVCLADHTSGTFATDLTALKWVATETVVDMDDELSVVYYIPTDFISLTRLSDENAVYRIVGTRLLSDSEGLSMEYTYLNDTPSTYSPLFKIAFASRIASEIAFPITQSATKAQALLEKYSKLDLPKAMFSDSKQGTPKELKQDAWENSRSIGAI